MSTTINPSAMAALSFSDLILLAGARIQYILDDITQAYTIYEPEVAESISREENQKIEDIKGHIKGIHDPDKLNFHVEQLKALLRIS